MCLLFVEVVVEFRRMICRYKVLHRYYDVSSMKYSYVWWLQPYFFVLISMRMFYMIVRELSFLRIYDLMVLFTRNVLHVLFPVEWPCILHLWWNYRLTAVLLNLHCHKYIILYYTLCVPLLRELFGIFSHLTLYFFQVFGG